MELNKSFKKILNANLIYFMWILCLWNIGNETFLFPVEINEYEAEQNEYADNS